MYRTAQGYHTVLEGESAIGAMHSIFFFLADLLVTIHALVKTLFALVLCCAILIKERCRVARNAGNGTADGTLEAELLTFSAVAQ